MEALRNLQLDIIEQQEEITEDVCHYCNKEVLWDDEYTCYEGDMGSARIVHTDCAVATYYESQQGLDIDPFENDAPGVDPSHEDFDPFAVRPMTKSWRVLRISKRSKDIVHFKLDIMHRLFNTPYRRADVSVTIGADTLIEGGR